MRRQGDRFALPTARGEPLRLEPKIDGLGRDPDVDRAWLRRLPRPWAVDLFAGAGGLSLGLREAGFHVIAAADLDERAVETHAANVPGICWALDLTKPDEFIARLRERGIEKVDLVAGGPPCQPFSRAGTSKLRSLIAAGIRDESDPRVDLWSTFLEVVDALSPQAVLLENVPDMARWGDGEILVNLMAALKVRGLEPEARVLNAWEYGVPQHRARLFVVATRRREFSWPRRRSIVTLRDAIGDLPPIPPAQRNPVLPYPGAASSAFQKRARRGLARDAAHEIWDHCSRDVRADDAEAFSLLSEGGTYADLPERLRRYRSDIFDDKYKRLAWDEVSRTITAHIAKDGYWYIHPDQSRTLSIREAARVQTFPDRFRFAGHPTAQLRQIGNAVPPALARAVGARVLASLDGRLHARPTATRFRSWSVPAGLVEPWLETRNPWLVLAGELALGRTNESVSSAAFGVLWSQAPSARDLLESSERIEEELDALGLSRTNLAKLRSLAGELVERFDGEVPETEDDLTSLPGVGRSVSTVVRCFGHGQPAVLLDASTRRLAARTSGDASSGAWSTRLELYRLAGEGGPDRAFNLRIRAVAKACCKARHPRCHDCPLVDVCRSKTARAVRTTELMTT